MDNFNETAGSTLVTFLLDRSGSMERIRDDTIGAFNAYLSNLQSDEKAAINFTLIQFDSVSLDKVCVEIPVGEVQQLTRETFVPRASTPLIDAACKTITAVEVQIGDERSTKIVICIQTDGYENSSVEHTWNDLNALIKEKSALGWQFNFMGAGIDAYRQGGRMGICADQTLSYDSANSADAFAAAAANTMSFAKGERNHTNFSVADKLRARDRYHPARQSREAGSNRRPRSSPIDDFTL